MAQFGKRSQEAASGTTALASTFRRYNIEVEDSVGNMRASEAVLGDCGGR